MTLNENQLIESVENLIKIRIKLPIYDILTIIETFENLLSYCFFIPVNCALALFAPLKNE
jgi:hypothetical protein